MRLATASHMHVFLFYFSCILRVLLQLFSVFLSLYHTNTHSLFSHFPIVHAYKKNRWWKISRSKGNSVKRHYYMSTRFNRLSTKVVFWRLLLIFFVQQQPLAFESICLFVIRKRDASTTAKIIKIWNFSVTDLFITDRNKRRSICGSP